MRLLILYEATLEDIERRIPVFMQKYFKNGQSEETLDLIKQLAELDPTKGKYTEWIVRQYKSKTIRIPEDNEKISKNLAKFNKVKGRLENKDINSYTPGSLAQALRPHGGESKRQTKKLGRKGKLVLPQGAELVLEKGKHKVVKITDAKASSILCSGTEWCVANPKTAKDYLKDGPLYLVYEGGEREYLVHYEEGQFMDVDDEEVDEETKEGLVNLLAPITGKTFHNNPKLAWWHVENFENVDNPGGRWPELEPALMKDPYVAFEYAYGVIEGRWPEAEPVIMKDPESAYFYTHNVIKERWPEAEEYIMQDGMNAYRYAYYVIRGRWPKAEPHIMKDAKWAYKYAENVIEGRWPEAEPYIMKDPKWARSYAQEFKL